MKYYVYISKSKVEMLYSQIPDNLKNNLAAELKIDLKLISASVSRPANEETLFSKLKVLVEHIKNNEAVGDIDLPRDYIYGEERMTWGVYENAMVHFSAEKHWSTIALAGSAEHLIGTNPTEVPQKGFTSLRYFIMGMLKKAIEDRLEYYNPSVSRPELPERDARLISDAHRMFESQKMPQNRFEFMAKTLSQNYDSTTMKRIILASPIYVALLD